MTREERHQQFTEDMEDAGYRVRDYQGRNYYHGPAIRLEEARDFQDVVRATKLHLTTDQMGKHGMIVYPA